MRAIVPLVVLTLLVQSDSYRIQIRRDPNLAKRETLSREYDLDDPNEFALAMGLPTVERLRPEDNPVVQRSIMRYG
ncbi:unnamed protein product [Dicrocoelium dendriticum]|nr:unnamed protein product [Dicrocoelium dendriticum]